MYQIIDLILFVILFLILTHKFNKLSINEQLVRTFLFTSLVIINRFNLLEKFATCYPETNKSSVYNSYKSNTKAWCSSDFSDDDDTNTDSGLGNELADDNNNVKRMCQGDTVTPPKKGTQTPLKSWCSDDGLPFEDNLYKPDKLHSALIKQKADSKDNVNYVCEKKNLNVNIHPIHDGPNIPKH